MQAVCFDLDGTLLHFTRDYGSVLEDAFLDVTGKCHDEWLTTYDDAFYRRFRACDDRPVERAFAETIPEFDSGELADALLQREIEMVEPAPGVEGVFDSLASRGSPIGVVTNGVPHWQRAKLDAYDLLEPIDTFVASYEAGAHKPDTAPFHLAEQRIGAHDYTMVGDDDADIAGARNAGWQAIRYGGDGFAQLETRLFE